MSVTHRFALCVSGAIALGAYEAGAVAQLYEDLQSVTKSTDGQVKLIIDVVAGSSAGAVTGLFLAQALAQDLTPAAFRQSLSNLWVKNLDILSLLSPASDPAQGLFTATSLTNAEAAAPQSPTSPSTYDSARVCALWISLTTPDGFPSELTFPRPLTRAGTSTPVTFYPKSYRDYSPFLFCGATIKYASEPIEHVNQSWGWTGLRDATWEQARESARASGAFPVAFRTRTIERDLRLYPETWSVLAGSATSPPPPGPAGTPLPSEVPLHYVDGGIFNNEPLGRAIDAATYLKHLDGSRGNDPRTYLVIEPDPAHRPRLEEMLAVRERAADANGWPPAAVVAKLFGAYFSDTIYRDFMAAKKTNEQLAALDKAAAETSMTPDQLAAVRAAVGLADKVQVTLERIPWDVPPADPPRLQGAFFGHFGGFLQQEFRQHDFEVGRREARDWLLNWLTLHAAALGLSDRPEDLVPAEVPSPPPLQTEPQWRSVARARRWHVGARGGMRILVLLNRWLRGYPLLLGAAAGAAVIVRTAAARRRRGRTTLKP